MVPLKNTHVSLFVSSSQNTPPVTEKVCVELRGSGHLKSFKYLKISRRKIDAHEKFEEAIFGEIDVRF